MLPRANLTGLDVMPGMVYFIMVASLLFFLYGAEEARGEQRRYQLELVRTLPGFTGNRLGKLLFWMLFTGIFYLIFFMAVVLYILAVHGSETIHEVPHALLYTVLCWWAPFFLSTVLGYVLYSLTSSLYSYVLISLAWFLIMPYNAMVLGDLMPREVAGWLIVGDPNIELIMGIYDMESQRVNRGFFIQRAVAAVVIIGAYIGLTWTRPVRQAALVCMAGALILPVFSPYVPYLTDESWSVNSYLPAAPLDEEELQYSVDHIYMKVSHGRSNHDLYYRYEADLEAESDTISFALWNDFVVEEVMLGDKRIAYTQQENLLILKLPSREGRLKLTVATRTYTSVGPNFAELPSVLPWYPMHPAEAIDPYHSGRKESYRLEVTGSESRRIHTNLSPAGKGVWEGQAYGPTIFYGEYVEDGGLLRPAFVSQKAAVRNHNAHQQIVQEARTRLAEAAEMPSKGFIMSTINEFAANPDEYFASPDSISRTQGSALDVLFLAQPPLR
ncbi:hypothetical protein PATA110616_14955 [Paenibacillus tarimensis]